MQRSQLKQQGQPHILSMTATPIPRSLALTIYGEYDLSVINEKPAGRKEIMTRYIVPEKRIQCYEFCKSEIRKGNQVFVICPLVEQSESLEVTSVLEEYEKLTKEFDGFAVEYLHGKMKSSEKDEIMLRFRNKEFDLLVSTSVIEVGIDIPDATVIIIEGSERFGLSQMHQFRGRVGRNDKQSYCFLMTTDGLSGDNRARIKAMIDHTDGFALSEIDLEQRGPGSVFGVRQSGVPDLQMASLGDVVMIERARNAADVLLQQDMTLSEYPILQNKLKNYQQKNLD
ncbi:MAG: helicase-related protein [Patescibacteria group bacterium]|nr:helicase-related protein [Patescibacteria group bacterium]